MSVESHDWELRNIVCPTDLRGAAKEILTFIQLPAFTAAYQQMELTDDEQRCIETGIMMNPTLAPVLPGSGGIRAFEFSTPSTSPGSLHLTACYIYFPETAKVALVELFETEELGRLDPEDAAELKRLHDEIQESGPEAWESLKA